MWGVPTCMQLQMATNMEAPMFIMFNIHLGVYMHVHVCAWCTPPHTDTHPNPIHPPANPQGGTPESVKIQ